MVSPNIVNFQKIMEKNNEEVYKENYNLTSLDEIMEYMWLKPNVTGLNVDIFVDDGGSYLMHNHELLLFVRNGYTKNDNTFIPFLILKEPQILSAS